MIEEYLAGYSKEEKADIGKDLNIVRSVCLPKVRPAEDRPPFYLASAGAPGARKSTILGRFVQANPEYGQAVYLDPNHRALKFMAHTYQAQSLSAVQMASSLFYLSVQQAAYEKWRAASNYITYTLLEEALEQRCDIVHDTTLTGSYVPEFLPKLKAAGYHTVLVLCYCEDSLRQDAVQYRHEEQRFYQSAPEEVLSKGKLFPEKMPLYFSTADALYLYWSNDLFDDPLLIATLDQGEFDIKQGCCIESFRNKYEEDRAALQAEGKNLPSWEELVQLYTGRFK
jgi:hypothetical protein